MIIKCKMCGGDIEFAPGATYGTCEYCGSTSTIPKAADEGKLNRYNRANHFRRQCEFDKAVAAYEKILEQDDTDAEAHWGAVISRYGIEYVEDPATKKRIPTCHRVQLTSILADEDYKAAVEYAPDAESRRLYEEEAARIAEIQKGILAISQHEKSYDVFICYKESDDNGQRTHDSQWAQDVYYGLTEQGYKVFFSRITLEDKLGQEYEPYIFAALNSARAMVVIGSKPEYFNAVWVRNEWSRYLALMAKDRKRLLIPCYRDMDPYDLPDELSSLQSQDMGKIGFMQDLIRGVRKVLDADKTTGQPKVVQQVVQAETAGAAPGVSSLMDRAYLFMEDGDFDSAEEYLNRVLDIDPKHAPAYVAKVCVALRIRKEAGLRSALDMFETSNDWQKAIRFAEQNQKQLYESYVQSAVLFREETRKQGIYNEALSLVYSALSNDQCLTAARQFRSIHGFKDAAQQEEAAINKGKRLIYNEASSMLKNARSVQSCQNARQQFTSIQGFLDADEQISACDSKAAAIKKKEREDALEREKQWKKKTRKGITVVTAIILAFGLMIIYAAVIKPIMTYNGAVSSLESKEYYKAITKFISLENYKDSKDKIIEAKQLAYNDAITALNNQNYSEAFELFLMSVGYNNSNERCLEVADMMTNFQRQTAIEVAIKYSTDPSFTDSSTDYTYIWQNVLGKYLAGTYTTSAHTVINKNYDSEKKGPSKITVSFDEGVLKFYCSTGFDSNYYPTTEYTINVSNFTVSSSTSVSGKFNDGPGSYAVHGTVRVSLGESISIYATKGLSSFNGDDHNFSLTMSR